jgi:peptidoglycan biosynthesis protein MviN/MurJ (putative lipid II flippase)
MLNNILRLMPNFKKPANSKKRIMQTGIGFTSGTIVSVLFQPLEVFKMSIILSPKINGNIWQKIKGYSKIVTDEHGVKGFWNGLTPAILRSSIGNTLYFIPLRIF